MPFNYEDCGKLETVKSNLMFYSRESLTGESFRIFDSVHWFYVNIPLKNSNTPSKTRYIFTDSPVIKKTISINIEWREIFFLFIKNRRYILLGNIIASTRLLLWDGKKIVRKKRAFSDQSINKSQKLFLSPLSYLIIINHNLTSMWLIIIWLILIDHCERTSQIRGGYWQ